MSSPAINDPSSKINISPDSIPNFQGPIKTPRQIEIGKRAGQRAVNTGAAAEPVLKTGKSDDIKQVPFKRSTPGDETKVLPPRTADGMVGSVVRRRDAIGESSRGTADKVRQDEKEERGVKRERRDGVG